MFARMLGASLAIFATLWFAWSTFRNPNLIPGLVMVGAFAVPLASVLFFFEVNAARNVSLRLVGKLIFLGGVVSVAVALVLFEATAGLIWWLGASSAGLVEEAAKLAAVLLIVRGGACARYPYILNGMLFGAAVGTGFAAFESAGYALRVGIAGGDGAMIDNIIARGMLSPLGHVVWTAIAAGALWRVKGGDGFRFEMLRDRRAYAPLALVCALHFLWNVPFEPPMHAKYLVLGAVAWIAAIALAQAGLRELARARADAQCVGAPTDPWPPRDGVA
jgi:RsiW-degrading membrane proteinase PrsW (M82 family)